MRTHVVWVLAVTLWGCGAEGPADDDGRKKPADAGPSCTSAVDVCSDPERSFCGADGECRGCISDGECAATDPSTPLCAPEGSCVGCRGEEDCSLDAPVCDAETRTCRACTADADCSSGVCDREEGRCVDAGDTFVVDDDAACAIGDGSAAAPFCSIVEALTAYATAPRSFVVVRAGSYGFPALGGTALPAFVGHDAAVSAPAGSACVDASGTATLFVRGFGFASCDVAVRASATTPLLRLERSTMTGGKTGVDCRAALCLVRDVATTDVEAGVRCSAGARCVLEDVRTSGGAAGVMVKEAQLEMYGGEVRDAKGVGLDLSDTESLVRDVRIVGTGAAATSPSAGVSCQGGYCAFDRTQILGGGGVGLLVSGGASFELVASVVADNGSTAVGTALAGGVLVQSAGSTRQVTNTTIVANRAPPGRVAGVTCGGAVELRNVIVWGNGSKPLDGACTATYSLFDANVPGIGNLEGDPLLTSTATGSIDVHLTSGSPCVDAGDPAGGAERDLDGDPRPNGGRVDVGADER